MKVPGDGEEGAGEAPGLAITGAGLAGAAGEGVAAGLEAGVAAGVGREVLGM